MIAAFTKTLSQEYLTTITIRRFQVYMSTVYFSRSDSATIHKQKLSLVPSLMVKKHDGEMGLFEI